MTLARAVEPIAAEEEWPTGGGEDEAAYALSSYALSVVAPAPDHVVSAEDGEETAAAVAAEEDESSENGLNAIGAASTETTPKVSSADEAAEEDEEEDDYVESTG